MFLKKLFGTSSQRYIKKLMPVVDQINDMCYTLESKSDQDLIYRTLELKTNVEKARNEAKNKFEKEATNADREKKILEAEQNELNSIMVEAFAMVKETCRRMIGQSWRISGQQAEWNMVPYDVQLLGAIVLHKGNVSEMKTGEGKTLVATMPIYLNALTGLSLIHI